MLARTLAPLALALATPACHAAPDAPDAEPRPRLGLMTTLPIYWPETGDVAEVLRAGDEGSWVRQALEAEFELEPLDTLDRAALAKLDRLLLAQPRVLSPAENVALDDWVRAGGRLLLLADPMLTRHSRFGIGDKRRPQDVALLSPILAHWGLELRFDPDQPEGEHGAELGGARMPVDLSGTLAILPGGSCAIESEGLLARCGIETGQVTILADAAVLDDPPTELRRSGLRALARLAFD